MLLAVERGSTGGAGTRLMTHHSTAEPNPALAPGGLEAFVLRSEHVWDLRMEDLEQLLGQLAHPKSASSLRQLQHEASSCPALMLLLEALPEPGLLGASQTFSFPAGI